MKAHSTSIGAVEQTLPFTTAPNRSRMMEVLRRRCSRRSSAQWQQNTAGSFRPRFLPVKQSSLSLVSVRVGVRDTAFGGCSWTRRGIPSSSCTRGQRKSFATDRIILIPGPPEEIKVVNEIFRLYALERRSTVEIVKMLNQRGIPCEEGRPWTRYIIRHMVTNPKYIGANVSNRLSAKLRGRRVNNPPDMWIRRDGAFEAIVDPELFQKAVEMAVSWQRCFTDEQLLERLRQFLKKNGRLTQRLMQADWDMPCSQVYDSRFGGLSEAYKLIGFRPRRNLAHIERDRPLLPIRRAFTAQVISEFVRLGAAAEHEHQTKLVVVNKRLKFRVSVSRCRTLKQVQSWKLFLTCPQKHHGNIVARLNPDNEKIIDYFFVPWSKKCPGQITVREKSFGELESRHFTDLGFLTDILATIGTSTATVQSLRL